MHYLSGVVVAVVSYAEPDWEQDKTIAREGVLLKTSIKGWLPRPTWNAESPVTVEVGLGSPLTGVRKSL